MKGLTKTTIPMGRKRKDIFFNRLINEVGLPVVDLTTGKGKFYHYRVKKTKTGRVWEKVDG